MEKSAILFPFKEIRAVQDELIQAVQEAVDTQGNLIVHAPTGLGKTVAALGPALKKAVDENLTIFFLTSRHTQHTIAVDTIKAIRDAYGLKIPVVNIIGKKGMCLQPGVDMLSSGEFSEYCKKVREDHQCEYYEKTRKKNYESTVIAKGILKELETRSPLHVQEIIATCDDEGLCPYEMALLLAEKAKVVVADYYYVFNPSVLEAFLKKTKKELEDAIIIVDEGHNLPGRIRELMSYSLSTLTIKQARKEVEELAAEECFPYLDSLQELLLEAIGLEEEKRVEGISFSEKEEMISILGVSLFLKKSRMS